MTGVPLNIDWQQILLHLFNFTILFGALYILLYKPVKNFMEGREAHYADMDSRAEQALADAENSKASYEQKEKDFDEEIRAEKSRLSKEIEAERERRLTAARGEAENSDRRRRSAWVRIAVSTVSPARPSQGSPSRVNGMAGWSARTRRRSSAMVTSARPGSCRGRRRGPAPAWRRQ